MRCKQLYRMASDRLSMKLEVTGVVLGTIKSRVDSARSRLATLLDINSKVEIGPDAMTQAALAAE
jgi:RNA polymerase sigma-70 factor (ECF subfamily)